MRSPPTAIVIGGSVGGLFAAHLLRGIGWNVTVFERVADDLASRGAGVGTHEALFQVMRAAGVKADDSIVVRVERNVCLDRDGRPVAEMRIPKRMCAWTSLYRPLRRAFPDERYRPACNLVRIDQDASGVTAVFEDGSTARGDLLIGADGVRSTVRALTFPGVDPVYAGYIAWRGMLPETVLSPAAHAAAIRDYAFCLPPGEQVLAYPVPGPEGDTRPGGRHCNFVWYHPVDFHTTLRELCTDRTGRCHGVAIPPPLIRPEVVAAMRAEARAKLAPQVVEILEKTERPFFQAIFDLESPRIVSGRIALLGDAAFVARPHVGLGVTKAALDAECLAQSIGGMPDDLAKALARYDEERRYYGRYIVERSRRLGAYIEAHLKPPSQRTPADRQPDAKTVLGETGSAFIRMDELRGARAA